MTGYDSLAFARITAGLHEAAREERAHWSSSGVSSSNHIKPDVFLSYASADRELAHRLADALRGLGFSVWWDRDIPAGRSFHRLIEEALDEARAVIVLWTENSLQSAWVRDEAQAALDRDVLVPLAHGGAKPPLGFRGIQTIAVTSIDLKLVSDAGQDVLQALRRLTPGSATPVAEDRGRLLVPIICATCSGLGKFTSPMKIFPVEEMCPTCNGNGYVLV